MNTFTTRYGTTIYYKDWGSGPVVTFSHGWPLSADAWDADGSGRFTLREFLRKRLSALANRRRSKVSGCIRRDPTSRPDDTSRAEPPHRDQATTDRHPRRAVGFHKRFSSNHLAPEPRWGFACTPSSGQRAQITIKGQ